MSRTIVVRRLTAIVVLLAILGFSLPATAAPARHSSRAVTAQAPGLLDQLLAWIGGLLPGHPAAPQGRTEKTISTGLIPSSGAAAGSQAATPSEQDRGGMIDPNG